MALDLLQCKTLMTLSEVAEVMRVSLSLVKKKVAKGEIPSVKIGRSCRCRPEDIYRYIAANTRQLGAANG